MSTFAHVSSIGQWMSHSVMFVVPHDPPQPQVKTSSSLAQEMSCREVSTTLSVAGLLQKEPFYLYYRSRIGESVSGVLGVN